MKNLENYGLQELNAQEIKETDGGWLDFELGDLVDFYIWAFTDGADAVGPQNPGANGYMGCKL